MSRHLPLALGFAAILAVTGAPAAAQSLNPTAPFPVSTTSTATQQLSANPFGLMLDLFNIDYERRIGATTAIGLGGSTATVDVYDYSDVTFDGRFEPEVHEERYLNADVYLRYYPGGKVLTGFSLGAKIGLTQVPDQGTYFGYGFDLNRSWMLNEHFYYGAGFGLKRLVGTDPDAFELEYVPTLRLNIGVGF